MRLAPLAFATALLLAIPASASATITPTSDPDALAGAIATSGVTDAAFFEVPPSGTPHATADSQVAGFPQEGSYAILTTGDPSQADNPDAATRSVALGGGSSHGYKGAVGNAEDTTVLQLSLDVPQGQSCVSFDFRFLSEEWPDNVGGNVNDGFLAGIDTLNGASDPSGDISAPDNFAFDQNGALISVNTASISAEEAAGTPYGGATQLLTARRSVTAGPHTLYLAIFDQGDEVVDSAVFVDNLQFSDLTQAECDQAVDRTAPAPTLDTPADGDSQTSPSYAGHAGTGATDSRNVTVQVYSGATVSGTPVDVTTASVQDDGTWSTGDSAGLSPGQYTVQAHQTDSAGNVGDTTAHTFTVVGDDTTPPTVTVTSPADGTVTSDTTPTIGGTAGTAPGDQPSIFVNIYEGSDTDGTLVEELGTVASGGEWSLDADELAEGQYTVQASQSDDSLNTGLSEPQTFRVQAPDTTAPTVRITSPADGSSTDDTTPTISGTAGTSTGDSGQVRVALHSGTSAGGAVVQTLTAQRDGGAWSVDAAELDPGSYTAVASQADASDNVGVSPSITFTVNAPPPPPPPPPADQQVQGTSQQSPEPVLNQTVVAGSAGGTVRVKGKDGKFRTLGANEAIPLGSTVDATKGKVRLTSASGPGGATQSALFYQGMFVVTQTRGSKPITQLALAGTLKCPKAGRASASARRKVRRLWGDGKGRFRTKGRHGAATVKGTKWLTQDSCDSTLVRVKRGTVVVRDFAKKKNITVKQGRSYVARAKKKK